MIVAYLIMAFATYYG